MANYTGNQSNTQVTSQSSNSWGWFGEFLTVIGVVAKVVVGIVDVLSKVVNQQRKL